MKAQLSVKQAERLNNLLAIPVFGSMVLLMFEMGPLENTIGGLNLFLWSCVFGMVAGIALASFISSQYLATSQHISIPSFYLAVIWSCTFLGPVVTSVTNRFLPSSTAYHKPYVVTGKCVTSGKGGGRSYYLLFSTGRATERVEVSRPLYQVVRKGHSVVFTVRSGFLGYPVVDRID